MKIIFYEMRKSWLKTATFIVLVILTILNFIRMNDYCVNGHTMTYTYDERGENYYRLYEKMCGELTDEKLASYRKHTNEVKYDVLDKNFSNKYQPDKYITGYVFGDFGLFYLDMGQEITYCVTYPNESAAIVANAAENYNFFKSVGNDYEAKKNLKVYNSYQDRSIPEYRATYWTGLFFQHEFSSLLCIVMLIFGLSASFSTEKESGMFQLITAAGSKSKTAAAKICSAAAYCAFLSIWFTACDLFFSNILLGVRGLDMPIYSARIFQMTPFTFSLLGAVLVWAGIRFLALLAISFMILAISKITPNTIIAMAVSFGSSLALILLTSPFKSVWNPVCAFTPWAYISDFSVVNIFGEPVLTLFAALIALVTECAALGSTIFLSDRVLRR